MGPSFRTKVLISSVGLLFMMSIFLTLLNAGSQTFTSLLYPGSRSSSLPSGKSLTDPVKTEAGLVQGVVSKQSKVKVFKGIPYAASTAGQNRWKAPSPRALWPSILQATSAGPQCSQDVPFFIFPKPDMSEDCLNLNIWTPANISSAQPVSAKEDLLPVYVWIHGGRFIFGSGSEAAYDGTALAEKGIVVVTFNYRLGILGFLSHPSLSEEGYSVSNRFSSSPEPQGSGNYGLLDQIEALKWVQQNIASFGGDPNKVTLGGQSAGAASVLNLLDSPLSENLFHSAVIESGAFYPQDPQISGWAPSYRTLSTAESQGQETVASKAGNGGIEKMRTLPVSTLVKGNSANDDTVDGAPPLYRPVLDGYVKPRTYNSALRGDSTSDRPSHKTNVRVLVGNNAGEAINDGGPFAPAKPAMTLQKYLSDAQATYGTDLVSEYLALYPASSDAEAKAMTERAAVDTERVSLWLWKNLRSSASEKKEQEEEVNADDEEAVEAAAAAAAAPAKTFTYFWTHAPPGSDSAGHSSEIAYAFNNVQIGAPASSLPFAGGNKYTAVDKEIAEQVSAYWANFIKFGNPNGAEVDGQDEEDGNEGLPRWPTGEGETVGDAAVMVLGREVGVRDLVDDESKIVFWRKWLDSRDKAW